MIPLNKDLRIALQKLYEERANSPYVITTERAPQRTSAAAIVNLFRSMVQRDRSQRLLKSLWTSTFITNAARKISTVGGSLRDVQMLAGHRALSTTQRYIEADVEAPETRRDLV